MIVGRKAFAGDLAVYQYSLSPKPLHGDGVANFDELLELLGVLSLLAPDPIQRPGARELKRPHQIARYILRHGRRSSTAQKIIKARALISAAADGYLDVVETIMRDAELKKSSRWEHVCTKSIELAHANRWTAVVDSERHFYSIESEYSNIRCRIVDSSNHMSP